MFTWLARIFGFRNETSGTANPARWLLDFFNGGSPSVSGVHVNAESALTLAAWHQGLNMLSGDIAKVPLHLYRRMPRGKERATKHPAYYLMRRKPNGDMTDYVWKRALMVQALVHGNGYAYINRDSQFRPAELVPLDSCSTWPVRENGRLLYVHRLQTGEPRKIPAYNVFHLKGMSADGIMGISVIDRAKESLGLALAADRYGSAFFGNGAQPGVVLKYPNKLTDEIIQQIRKSWTHMHQGVENTNKLAVLEAGVDVVPIPMNNEQAQFLQTRKYSRQEIASWLNVPAYRLGDEARTGFASLEQSEQSYLDSSLEPWLIAFECEAFDKLLTEQEKRSDDYYFEFLRLALLKMDGPARSAFYHGAILDGWMNRNEVRERENLNQVDGLDEFLEPMNERTVGQLVVQPNNRFALPSTNGNGKH